MNSRASEEFPPTALKEPLDKLAAVYTQLSNELTLERDALRAGAAEAIADRANAKHQLIAQAEVLEQQLKQELDHFGFPSLSQAIAAQPPSTQRSLTEQRDFLRAQVELCHRQNRINGAIVATSHHMVRQILALLQNGDDPARATALTYGKQGMTNNLPTGTLLTEV